MNLAIINSFIRGFGNACVSAWDSFWFTPRLPDTVCVLRILTGAMLLYSHLVLASELTNFVGDNAWINNQTAQELHDGKYVAADMARSYLWHISSPSILWAHHTITLLVTTAMMVGFMTRVSVPLAWFLQIMYIHRLTGALFGFDQIVTYCAMYLILAPSGSRFSVDAWLARRRAGGDKERGKLVRWLLPPPDRSASANIATRLLQLHLCVIYLFGGLAKARGETWWDGTAVWYSVANLEYQSIDMTWLANYPHVFSSLAHVTMFWEIFYCALIWHRKTRWIALIIALGVHGGIALFMGMATFGLMMIFANLIFVRPESWPWRKQASANSMVGNDAAVAPEERLELDQSGSPEDLAELSEKLAVRQKKVQVARRRIKKREAKLKEQTEVYRRRVKRLKKREEKIKRFVAARKARKSAKSKPKASE